MLKTSISCGQEHYQSFTGRLLTSSAESHVARLMQSSPGSTPGKEICCVRCRNLSLFTINIWGASQSSRSRQTSTKALQAYMMPNVSLVPRRDADSEKTCVVYSSNSFCELVRPVIDSVDEVASPDDVGSPEALQDG